MSVADTFRAIFQMDSTPSAEFLILNIRLPRILLAAVSGAGLAIAGAAIQGLFRNPLADPSLIGVTSGAMLFAVFVHCRFWLDVGFDFCLFAANIGGFVRFFGWIFDDLFGLFSLSKKWQNLCNDHAFGGNCDYCFCSRYNGNFHLSL